MTKSQKTIALTLLILAETLLSAQLDTISIYSSIMDTTRKAIIVLPEDYFSSNKNFPVVYLLHGWSGCYKDWASHMITMKDLADTPGTIGPMHWNIICFSFINAFTAPDKFLSTKNS